MAGLHGSGRNQRFCQIERSTVDRADFRALPDACRLLYYECRLLSFQGQPVELTNAVLAARLGRSVRSIRSVLRTLEAAGFVRIDQLPGRPRVLAFTLPVNQKRLQQTSAAEESEDSMAWTLEDAERFLQPAKPEYGCRFCPDETTVAASILDAGARMWRCPVCLAMRVQLDNGGWSWVQAQPEPKQDELERRRERLVIWATVKPAASRPVEPESD